MELDPPSPPADIRDGRARDPGHDAAREAMRAAAALLAGRLDRPLVLVGMMGVGKSSVGRKLAAALGWPFVDADDAIEAAAQMTIPEIFEMYGEAAFRDGERRVIARLLADDTHAPGGLPLKVIATGGGAFINPDTRALILDKAIAVWLDAELDTLVDRTARKGNRPLLRTGDPREILGRLRAERAPHYAAAPVRVISGNAPQARTLASVIAAVHDHVGGPVGTPPAGHGPGTADRPAGTPAPETP